jgi:dTDP-4-amino-4,6-dideoxygalactose transaminase
MNFFSNKKNIIDIVNTVKEVVGNKTIYLHEPSFNVKEAKYVNNCLRTNMVSSIGPYVNLFEKMIQDYTKSKYCIATSTGTSALHASLYLSGVISGDEVLMPSFNFIASANATIYLGASPIFLDIEKKTLGLDPFCLQDFLKNNTYQHSGKCINKKTNKIIKALILLHTFGHPADLDKIIKILRKHNILLIEDAAESIGSYYYGKHVGTFGTFGVLSFNGNKTITTGGGGMIMTNLKSAAKLARHIVNTAKVNHKWSYKYDQLGYNYRMPNINAAIGCAQIEKIEYFIKRKRKLFFRYKKKFNKFKNLVIFEEPKGCRSNYWLQTLIFNKPDEIFKKKLLKACYDKKIYIRPAWNLLHTNMHLKKYQIDNLSKSNQIFSSLINLPSSSFL